MISNLLRWLFLLFWALCDHTQLNLFYHPFHPNVTHMRKDTRASPSFLYWKERKAGRGLGTRLGEILVGRSGAVQLQSESSMTNHHLHNHSFLEYERPAVVVEIVLRRNAGSQQELDLSTVPTATAILSNLKEHICFDNCPFHTTTVIMTETTSSAAMCINSQVVGHCQLSHCLLNGRAPHSQEPGASRNMTTDCFWWWE